MGSWMYKSSYALDNIEISRITEMGNTLFGDIHPITLSYINDTYFVEFYKDNNKYSLHYMDFIFKWLIPAIYFSNVEPEDDETILQVYNIEEEDAIADRHFYPSIQQLVYQTYSIVNYIYADYITLLENVTVISNETYD